MFPIKESVYTDKAYKYFLLTVPKMKFVFVMLHNVQDYILDNIRNLLFYDNHNIVVITDMKFFNLFDLFRICLVSVESLISDYDSYISKMDGKFRNGFAPLTSYRFKVLYEYMFQYKVHNIIHLENDVMVFHDFNDYLFHSRDKILITMDHWERCIPGFMFIPDATLLKKCLDYFEPQTKLNDMQNWAKCYHRFYQEGIIDTLPIGVSNIELLSRNITYYNAFFDAAAIGQFLGGVDPRNVSGNTVGYVNDVCLIDYSKYNIRWYVDGTRNRFAPFIHIDGCLYKIMNLHVHCKNLKQFSCLTVLPN